ncbi:UNVERIFIED_CONTAM: hypothetical protein DES50_11183 [Williamsia faeni]
MHTGGYQRWDGLRHARGAGSRVTAKRWASWLLARISTMRRATALVIRRGLPNLPIHLGHQQTIRKGLFAFFVRVSGAWGQ